MIRRSASVPIVQMQYSPIARAPEVMDKYAIKTTVKGKIVVTPRVQFLWLPRYHCELMPVERIWSMTKGYAKAWCSYDLKLLMMTGGIIDSAVARIKTHHVRAFIDLSMRYAEHYSAGCAGLAPGKIRRVGYDLFVSQGIMTREEVDQLRANDRASLDAMPECLVGGKHMKKQRQSSEAKKAAVAAKVLKAQKMAASFKKQKT